MSAVAQISTKFGLSRAEVQKMLVENLLLWKVFMTFPTNVHVMLGLLLYGLSAAP
jgi:hypothetical protein